MQMQATTPRLNARAPTGSIYPVWRRSAQETSYRLRAAGIAVEGGDVEIGLALIATGPFVLIQPGRRRLLIGLRAFA
jgi:hypothetical protein